jgi:hypothetical protein
MVVFETLLDSSVVLESDWVISAQITGWLRQSF